MARSPKVGETAPGFALKDQYEEEFRLSDFKGKRVLLSFHPLAWTPVCAKQMRALEDNKRAFDSLNTVAVGMSVDTVPSKRAWADSLRIRDTRLLSDFWPHGKVAKQYGLFLEKYGISGRANIIIDENGRIAFFKVYGLEQLPDIRQVISALRKIR